MTEGISRSFAACATPCAWLPDENATTPPGALLGRDRGQLVERAAELERAGALQGLGLEEDARAGRRIEHRRGDERRAQRNAGKAPGGRIDIGGGRRSA